jgi:hypothetical protein
VLFKRTKRKREKAHEASWRKWLKPALVFVSGFVPLAKLLLRKPYVVAACVDGVVSRTYDDFHSHAAKTKMAIAVWHCACCFLLYIYI